MLEKMIIVETDLQTVSLCPSSSLEEPGKYPELCLASSIICLSYMYLLLVYVKSLIKIRSKSRQNLAHNRRSFNRMDKLDKYLTILSVLRLLIPPAHVLLYSIHPGLNLHQWFPQICFFIWEFILCSIFLRFVIENYRVFRRLCWVLLFSLVILYMGIYGNYFRTQPLQLETKDQSSNSLLCYSQVTQDLEQKETKISIDLYLPLIFPLIILSALIVVIGIKEFRDLTWQEKNPVNIRKLSPNIWIELKNRKSFIFQSVTTVSMSLIMRIFPYLFLQVLGNVIYFLTSDWLQMLMVYKCILKRIHVKGGQVMEEDLMLEEELMNQRDSAKILIELEDFRPKK